MLQFRSQQVSVLGNVANPGRYPLETTGMRLSEILSVAGGVNETGSNNVLLITLGLLPRCPIWCARSQVRPHAPPRA